MKATFKKKWFFYFLGLFGIAVIMILYFFHTIVCDNKKALKQMNIDSISLTDVSNRGYSKDLNLPKDLVFKGAIYSKTRAPIEKFENKDAYFLLYRLPVNNDKSLSEVINIKNKSVTRDHVGYYELTNDFAFKEHSSYNIMYRPGKPQNGTKIILALDGSDFKILKQTDSLYICYDQIRRFAMRYGDDCSIDFFGEIKTSTNFGSLPVQFAFRKANNHYYCLLMITKN